MIKFEEMPPSAQKSFKVTNSIRKVFMFIGWGLYILTFVSVLFDKHSRDLVNFLFAPLILGGFLLGIIHGAFSYKKTFKNSGILLYPFGMVFIIFKAFIFGVIGGFFLIADTISFFKKKPLIYQFEMHKFLESQKVQAEINNAAYNSLLNSDNLDKIQQLKEMMENGTITEEEFKQKKEQLLSKV